MTARSHLPRQNKSVHHTDEPDGRQRATDLTLTIKMVLGSQIDTAWSITDKMDLQPLIKYAISNSDETQIQWLTYL